MKHELITLFTGAGGLDWGFHKNDNYDLILSNEILEPHLRTCTQNNDIPLISLDSYDNQRNVGVCGDIHDLNIEQESDIVIGGPPCQDFSVLRGKDKRNGVLVKRGKLYQQFLRIIKKTNPKVFVFENVPGMKSANKGTAYEIIQKDFQKEGYVLVYNDVLNTYEIGTPQSRKRLIIIGVKNEYIDDIFKLNTIIEKYLKNSYLKQYPLTTLEVFEGKTLESLQNEYMNIMEDYKYSTKNIKNEVAEKWETEYSNLSLDIVKDYHYFNNIKDIDSKRFKIAMKEHEKILKLLGYFSKAIRKINPIDNSNSLPKSNKKIQERMYHIPPSYNFKIVEGTDWAVKGMMSNIYRRIHPLKTSPTIIAYGGGGTGGYHYEYNRQGLSNRERARLQTFPDDYLFNGTSTEIRAQIGEAVPPILSYNIAQTVNSILTTI
ncbi:MAG: DNA cytosine methyltransferase [Methanobrevibacter sp.]|nr:DNA cytosine methyltransferase [Methanobrevibacter sp.]